MRRGEGTDVEFAVTDTAEAVRWPTAACCRTCFARDRAWSPKAGSSRRRFGADTVLAKHDETYMPPEVAKALKEQGRQARQRRTHEGRAKANSSPASEGQRRDRGARAFRADPGAAGRHRPDGRAGAGARTARSSRPDGRRRAGGALPVRPRLLVAFLALMHAYVTSDFSVANVADNSHSTKPLLYRISGVWGNHEGSMLLWVLILALFGAAVAVFGRNLPPTLRANVLAVQALDRRRVPALHPAHVEPVPALDPPPAEGRGLNPILQDPALAFHPPFLYAGYVGFSMAFSFAIAALIEGRIDAAWARWVRPWTLAAWMCLTIGIAMGSWWAYYELGWGGWWFWDPVENASFMPWLAGTALLHSALVMEKRDALKVWTVLLAILTFSLWLMGTFLVRSGVLTSVHAFAVDPRAASSSSPSWCSSPAAGWRCSRCARRELRQGGIFAPISREGALVLNNILLTAACATVLVGTLYPLVLEALTGAKISVGAALLQHDLRAADGAAAAGAAVRAVARLEARRSLAAAQRLMFAAVLALVVMVARLGGVPARALAGAVRHRARRVGHGRRRLRAVCARKLGDVPLAEVLRRLRNLPRSAYGTALAHFGVGMMVIGIVATSAYQSERVLRHEAGRDDDIAGYELTFHGVGAGERPELPRGDRPVDVTRGGAPSTRLEPRSASTTCRRSRPRRPASTRPGAAISTSCWAISRRRRLCRPPLLQSACALHLARRAGHVPRRRRVADRPAACASARRPRARRAAAGARGMRRAAHARVLGARRRCSSLLLPPASALRRRARRDPARPGARERARATFRRPALPRLPEPVDRR